MCSCKNGYDGTTCVDIDEFLNDICSSNAKCTNSDGSYRCSRVSGFVGNEIECIDVSECNNDPFDSNTICNNTSGGYECNCNLY